jgi:ubiquinone/menaquinone biosynthesis C-methylase UbiE/DNA-binding transcriptional ArsR family regulator
MTLSLEQSTALCRLLADASRMRLLLLLEEHELSVAELTQVTRLAQSRVSTHLARLQRSGLVQQRRVGAAAYYAASDVARDNVAGGVWALLREQVSDSIVRVDRERAAEVIRQRKRVQTWAESVAGRMERQYSPGRTWEATARALIGLFAPGDVLDIACGDGVLAELLAPQARSITAVDISPTLIAAARDRLKGYRNVRLLEGDMHALPLESGRFDHVFLMHALAYTKKPPQVVAEAARLLKPGGLLVVAALNAHQHKATMQAYDHVNLGIAPTALRKLLEQAGLAVTLCSVTSREERPPYFEVVTALAQRAP